MQDDQFDQIEESAPAISLREYADILRRRRAVIIQTFVLVLVVGVVVTLMSAPTYRSEARLLVDSPFMRLNQVNTENPLSELLAETQQYRVQTQVELLQSEKVRLAAAKRLGDKLPEMTIAPVPDTEIITVVAEGPDAQVVGKAPNLLLESYIDQTGEVNNETLNNALTTTTRGAERARRTLEETEAKLRRFQERHNVAELEKNRDIQMTAVESLTNTYQGIQAELGSVRAQIAATKRELAAAPRTRNTEIVSAEADPAVQAIETQLATLEAERASLLQVSGTSLELIAARDVQIAALRKRLAGQRASVSLRNQRGNPARTALQDRLVDLEINASGLASRAADTAQRRAQAQTRLRQFPAFQFELARLSRLLEEARSNYATFSRQRDDLRMRQLTRRKNARIIETAKIPIQPIRPKKLQNVLFAAFMGLFFGLCLALLQEFLDDRINSTDEAERVLRLPSLGLVPAIEEEGLRLIRDLKAFSPITEAYRSLRSNIAFAAVDNPVRAIAVTSSGPGEGKSTTIANLAMAMAMDGKRVIVVDADLRRPTQHKLFKVNRSPGLTDILVGTHGIGEVVRPTVVDNVVVIPAGSTPPNPAELLGSEAMAHFVEAVRNMADIILFDAPPTLAVADAVLLSSRVDGALFVVGFGDTKKTNARHALELLSRARVHMLGTVLNKMDEKSRGYYYSQYYYTPVSEGVVPDDVKGALTNGNGTDGYTGGNGSGTDGYANGSGSGNGASSGASNLEETIETSAAPTATVARPRVAVTDWLWRNSSAPQDSRLNDASSTTEEPLPIMTWSETPTKKGRRTTARPADSGTEDEKD